MLLMTRLFDGRHLVLFLALGFVLVMLLLLWHPAVELRLEPGWMQHEAGHSYVVALRKYLRLGYTAISDNEDAPAQSTLVLLRNGEPLGPPHALHEVIRHGGGGAYSHWNDALNFSAPGNIDPSADGAQYVVRMTLVPGPVLSL